MSPVGTVRSANTILYVARFAECVTFYGDTLALPVRFRNDWFVEFELCGQACLSVADERRASVKSSAGGGVTITLQVADVATVRVCLLRRHVAVGPLRERFGSQVFYVRDPENNRLEFWQAP